MLCIKHSIRVANTETFQPQKRGVPQVSPKKNFNSRLLIIYKMIPEVYRPWQSLMWEIWGFLPKKANSCPLCAIPITGGGGGGKIFFVEIFNKFHCDSWKMFKIVPVTYLKIFVKIESVTAVIFLIWTMTPGQMVPGQVSSWQLTSVKGTYL